MAFGTRRTPHTTTTAYTTSHAARPSLMQRLRARKTVTTTTRAPRTHRQPRVTASTHTTTHTTAPRRKSSMGDKVSGAMLKLRGSLTGRPGLKGAGTRRMHGTDGRGTHRYY